MKRIILLLLYLICVKVMAQQHQIDSLNGLIENKETSDSIKVKALFNLTEYLYLRNFDTILPLSNRALQIITRNKKKGLVGKDRIAFLKMEATGHNNIGVYRMNKGESDKALKCFLKAVKLQLESKDYPELANSYNNIGSIYHKQGKIKEALDHFNKGMKIAKKIGDPTKIGANAMFIGIIAEQQGNIDKALQYFEEAMENYTKAGNKYGISMVNHNIAGLYMKRKEIDKALEFYEKALVLKEEIGDFIGMGYSLNNMAKIYLELGRMDEAMELFNESYNLFVSQNYKDGIANSCGNLSKINLDKGDYSKAMKYGEEAYALAKETGYPENLRNASLALYNVYDKMKKYDKAIEMYRLYCDMRDSIANDKTRKASIEVSIQHQYDKKSLKDSLNHLKENELNEVKNSKLDSELKAQATVKYFLYGGLALVLLFAGFMYNRFLVTRKQKTIIEKQKGEVEIQKHVIEEKQKEITDSINYARRIQYSLLAHEEILKENLGSNGGDHFVFFQPKDIVSGDFYWCARKGEDFYLAVCDCTGHGVPGAFMSLLNISFLNEAIIEKNIVEPNRVLDFVRTRLMQNMEGGQDGMDAVLMRFTVNKIQYAAAHNNPILIRDSKIEELSADKMPVGKGENTKPFTLFELEKRKGDAIYLFTDGYADQFGGEKGKKFKYSNLQNLLLEKNNLELSGLNLELEKTFTNWKGDLEQVDDVCIIGIKI